MMRKNKFQECVSTEILIKELKQMFKNLETVSKQIMDLDPNVERSTLVHRIPKNRIRCYHKLHEKKKEGYISMSKPRYHG
jgi:hypothetical protein